MSRQIYRAEALQRLASPEQLDQLMPLTSPRGWIALAALGTLLVLALLWSIFGTIETTVGGEGALVRPGGVQIVAALQPGTVAALFVQIGDDVQKGQGLLRVAPGPSGGKGETDVVSSVQGRVVDIAVGQGDRVEPKSPLVVLEPMTHPPRAIVYVPAREGYRVRPGLDVQLWLATEDDRRAPALWGRVRSAGKYPATLSAMMNTLQNDAWVSRLAHDGPCLEIVVELTGVAPGTARQGASAARATFPWLYSGTPCRARITVGTFRPIRLILPVSPSA